MKRTAAAALLLACLLAAAAAAVSAQDADKPVDAQHFWGPGRPITPRPPVVSTTRFVATLRGSTSASAAMSLTVDTVAQTASYTLQMNNIPGYTMSHIHVVRS
jgi:ABC-type glycerol-3-phosphate transport system substrate-binding protein